MNAFTVTTSRQSVPMWLKALLIGLAFLLACGGVFLFIEFAPHYLVFVSPSPTGVEQWATTTQTLVENNSHRFSVWRGELSICGAESTSYNVIDRQRLTQYLANWFHQQGWNDSLRDAAHGWNMCDNSGLIGHEVDLAFEKPQGFYYRPAICVAILSDPQSKGFKVIVTSIYPSPLTSWDD